MNSLSIGLTKEELYEVTHYHQPKKQIHALTSMDIPFKVRPDGSVFVACSSIENESIQPLRKKPAAWKVDM